MRGVFSWMEQTVIQPTKQGICLAWSSAFKVIRSCPPITLGVQFYVKQVNSFIIMNLQSYLNFAKQLAYRAGRISLSYYNKGIQHDLKSDESPVTAADRATEEFIRGEIEKNYPTHAIVGEEFGESAGQGNPFRWIVDPIDGTKSFIKGVPFYSVLIGLEIEGVSRVGVVCFPALDEILYAADDLGAWLNGK